MYTIKTKLGETPMTTKTKSTLLQMAADQAAPDAKKAIQGAERGAKAIAAAQAKPHRVNLTMTPEEFATFHRVAAKLQLATGQKVGNEKTVALLCKMYDESH